MSPKERILTAIRHELPDRVPAHAISIHNIQRYLDFLGLKNSGELYEHFGFCVAGVNPPLKKSTQNIIN